jgi:hypothetical protein
LPTRLRQLELGLPAPGREPADATSRADTGVSQGHASLRPEVAPDFDLSPELDHSEPEIDPADADQLPAAAERPRDPQWQDPYAAKPDGNGHGWRESGAVSPGGPVFGPWPREGVGHSRAPRNGSRNGNGSGRAETRRPESGSPDSGPLNRDRRDRDWREGDSRGRGRPDAGRPDVGRPPRPRPERERPDPRPPDLRPPTPDRLDPMAPEAPQQDTVQHGTLRRFGASRPDAARPEIAPPDADRADMTSSESSRPGLGAGPDAEGLDELVELALTRCQAAEGRNMFGTYGSSGLTPAMLRLAAQLPVGGLAPGSEADSLKPPDRFAAKLSRLIARNPARSPADLAETISDAVRYAFAFEAADYTEGTWLVHRKLKSQGFELEARRNRWESPEYKGIFTRWRDPAHGIAFEVQFHTMASWAVAKRTHDTYMRITDPATPQAERAQLRAVQVVAAASAKAPPGCMEIADFRAEPR